MMLHPSSSNLLAEMTAEVLNFVFNLFIAFFLHFLSAKTSLHTLRGHNDKVMCVDWSTEQVSKNFKLNSL